MATIEKLPGKAFLAFPEMKNLLAAELASRFDYGKVENAPTIEGKTFVAPKLNSLGSDIKGGWFGDLFYAPDFDKRMSEKFAGLQEDQGQTPYWARTTMLEPFLVRFESIGEAASALKQIQRNWAPYQYQLFRRASLIQEKLPYINLKVRKFPANVPNSPMGLYTLIDDRTMLASSLTTSPLPAGAIQFEEDHENPPSRAYLKIQESLTLFHTFFGIDLPHGAGAAQEGEATKETEASTCFEAGACPGGWTWVLRQLGSEVFAVDRAELAPSLMKDPHVKFLAHDAFTLKPEEVCAKFNSDKIDWLLSDVICYPERLLEWINMWRDSGRVKNIICTIKMQGAVNWDLIKIFAAIPNSKIVHLNYNKHELTIMIHDADVNS